MAISLSIEQLKSVDLRKRADGFLLFKAVKELREGIYQINLNGKLLTIKSDQPLPLQTPLKAILHEQQQGNGKIFQLLPVKEKSSLLSAVKPEAPLPFFSTSSENQQPAALLMKLLFQRGFEDLDAIPQALKRLQKRYSQKKSLYPAKERLPFLKTAVACAFAQKGMILPDSVAPLFLNLLFSFESSKNESEEEALLQLFNHSKNLLGLQWLVFPFSLGEGENRWEGSFTVGIEKFFSFDSDGVIPSKSTDGEKKASSQDGCVRYFTINSSFDYTPFSIHFDLSKKYYYFCGDYFLSDLQTRKEIQSILKKTEFSLGNPSCFPAENFDGFEIFSQKV